MCDAFVAVGDSTADSTILFARNSDKHIHSDYAVYASLAVAVWRREERRLMNEAKGTESLAGQLMRRKGRKKAVGLLQEFVEFGDLP